ncbi:MAG: hypothetical protein MZU97_19050 [Bacillus subtilis]|nr:hypothetical protein [Bacillus subtilis]
MISKEFFKALEQIEHRARHRPTRRSSTSSRKGLVERLQEGLRRLPVNAEVLFNEDKYEIQIVTRTTRRRNGRSGSRKRHPDHLGGSPEEVRKKNAKIGDVIETRVTPQAISAASPPRPPSRC